MGIGAPFPGGVKPPVLDPARPKIVITEFPGRYLTPFHHRMYRLWRRKRDGFTPRTDGCLHWPSVMVQSLSILDREVALRDKRG